MASFSATVPSTRPADEVFAYLADFRSVAEWDPSITVSVHTNDGEPIQVGAKFHVVTSMLGKEITIEPDGPGCNVTYEAVIELEGARKVGDPLMGVALTRLGHKAEEGLREKLDVAY